jgi:hypothetical protein
VRDVGRVPQGPFKPDADAVGLWHFDEDAAAYAMAGGFADASATKNDAKLKDAKADGAVTNGGFDNTVGGKTRWADMDFGPFFNSTITPPLDKANVTHKAISIQLGKDRKHFVTFDTELLRMSAAWEGSFLKIPAGREGLSNHPEMGGKPTFATAPEPGWQMLGQPEADLSTAIVPDPRAGKLGPLPRSLGRYGGMYVHGDSVVLSYAVGDVPVLERPAVEQLGEDAVFVRTVRVAASKRPMLLRVLDLDSATRKHCVYSAGATFQRVTFGSGAEVVGVAMTPQIDHAGTFQPGFVGDGGPVYFQIPPHAAALSFEVLLWRGPRERLTAFEDRVKNRGRSDDLAPAMRGGPARYPDPIVTKGVLGKAEGPYAVDTLTAPDDNPWHSFLRFGGLDFFKNGDAAVCSVSGDVWVVSGIDDTLDQLKWRRFATGLFQPLGLKVVDDKVYVLGRDQITRLHDLNGDGEADFYENFNNDGLVTANGHAYVTCLETDPGGNFYYVKCGDSTPHGGTVLRVSKDGSKLDVVATGVRNANGLGVSPTGLVTEADNQGEWVPASRIDVVQEGGFLGYQPMSKRSPPPTDPGKPMVWMPQNVDNSAGGQVWVEGDRWGLPAGTMLHTSYGQAALLQVLPETLPLPGGGSGGEKGGQAEVTQAGVWRFPLTFSTGIMRGRFRPTDGQLYVCGLRGWQTAGTKDGALQRVRYTGKPVHAPVELHVHANGLRLRFASELDRQTAADADSWSVLQWNYRWSAEYGSKQWSAVDPNKQGFDTLEVKRATLLPDGRTVFLEVPGLRPVMQMRISCNVEAKDGTPVRTDVYNTIHALGPAFDAGAGK